MPLQNLVSKVLQKQGIAPTEGEPGKEDREHVVEQLDVEEKHSHQVVTALIHPTKMHERIQTGSKRPVEPSSTLADEFWSAFRHVCITLGCLDIR